MPGVAGAPLLLWGVGADPQGQGEREGHPGLPAPASATATRSQGTPSRTSTHPQGTQPRRVHRPGLPAPRHIPLDAQVPFPRRTWELTWARGGHGDLAGIHVRRGLVCDSLHCTGRGRARHQAGLSPSQCSPVSLPKPSRYASQPRKKFTEPSSRR